MDVEKWYCNKEKKMQCFMTQQQKLKSMGIDFSITEMHQRLMNMKSPAENANLRQLLCER